MESRWQQATTPDTIGRSDLGGNKNTLGALKVRSCFFFPLGTPARLFLLPLIDRLVDWSIGPLYDTLLLQLSSCPPIIHLQSTTTTHNRRPLPPLFLAFPYPFSSHPNPITRHPPQSIVLVHRIRPLRPGHRRRCRCRRRGRSSSAARASRGGERTGGEADGRGLEGVELQQHRLVRLFR